MEERAKDHNTSTANRHVRSERPFPLVTNERLPGGTKLWIQQRR